MHAQSFLFCKSMDCHPAGSSVHGVLQARILEWVAMPSSRGSSQPRDWTCLLKLLHWQVDTLPMCHNCTKYWAWNQDCVCVNHNCTKFFIVPSKDLVLYISCALGVLCMIFSGGSDGKESVCNAGDSGLTSGSGRSSGEGNSHPPHYSCQENSMDRGTYGLQPRGSETVGHSCVPHSFSHLLPCG